MFVLDRPAEADDLCRRRAGHQPSDNAGRLHAGGFPVEADVMDVLTGRQIAENFGNESEDIGESSSSSSPYADPEDSELVAEAKKSVEEPLEYNYTERDVILYNLGVGATEQELQWTFESDDEFAALPTFGVIPQFAASGGISLDWLPNYNPVRDMRVYGLCVMYLDALVL